MNDTINLSCMGVCQCFNNNSNWVCILGLLALVCIIVFVGYILFWDPVV